MKTLGPCDIDLSRPNPPPQASAVDDPSPLSPVATQRSLPSGRYPLLGPDFHRPDRTSLRLAHSLDHPVGAGKQNLGGHHGESLRRREIDHEFELRRRLHRKIRWLRTAKDATDIFRGTPEQVRGVRPFG